MLFKIPEDDVFKVINPGSYTLLGMELEAGKEYEFGIYTNWTDADLLPRDWSLVVWSEVEPVNITHKDPSIKSSSFAVQSLK